jgi:class 3 adenylate cyclase/PAS domain-containing protein
VASLYRQLARQYNLPNQGPANKHQLGVLQKSGGDMIRSLGVRGRLLLAFLGISAFAVIAAIAALYAFSRAGGVLEQITQRRLPPVLASLELSRQAERIVGAAPALLAVSNQTEREHAYKGIAQEVAHLSQLLNHLEGQSGEAGDLIRVSIAPLVHGFEGNLDDLNFLVEERLTIAAHQTDLLARFTGTVREAQRDLAPSGLLLDSAVSEWVSAANTPAGGDPAGLSRELMPLLPQRKAEVLIGAVNDAFLRTVLTESPDDLTVQTFPIERSLAELTTLSAVLPDILRLHIEAYAMAVRELFDGSDGLIDARRQQFEATDRATRVLSDNAELAQHLTAAVDRLVETSKEDIRQASLEALDVQAASSKVLIAVVILSLVSAGLIVWLYVDRDLVARLTGLSDSMLALAGGDLRAPLPTAGSRDEIGRMAHALLVFRDQAIVVEENNLQEISKARQRLIDALESTSEGFAFFDADDRLEMHNSSYRELLRHGHDVIKSGTSFEAIIRDALDHGAIADVGENVETWIARRLARHRNPGQPLVQRRADGRWIQINERRTESGGTVAVYSDITALKQREEELRNQGRVLQSTLEHMSQGITMFDQDLRLIVVNQRFLELLDFPSDRFTAGDSLEDMFRFNAERGEFGPGDVEQQVEARLDLARKFEPHRFERTRPDGTVLEVHGMPVPGSGFVTTYTDVTELKRREQAVRDSEQRLVDAIESISEGFCLYGPDDRLVLSNTRYQELYPGNADIIEPGVSFETVIRTTVGRGIIGDAAANDERWVKERLREHRTPTAPRLQMQSDDRWILISEHKTHDRGTVGVYTDVTELKRREQQLEAANLQITQAVGEIERKNQELESLSSKLAKYLSRQVYDSIFAGRQEVKIASQRKKLTVFFSDLANFTETTDRLESEELTQLLNQYLTEMTRIAMEHGATVDKYVGDAIVIFFGDPESRGTRQDALACVEMALAMQRRMHTLATGWRDAGIERPLQCRIGISTGYCTVGNFGSEERMDYTIVGGGVNLASRLEHLAPPGGILISYETYALVKDEVRCEERGAVQVKGIAYPIATYEVIDIAESPGKDRGVIREDDACIRIELDLDQMSDDERNAAIGVLQRTLSRLLPA